MRADDTPVALIRPIPDERRRVRRRVGRRRRRWLRRAVVAGTAVVLAGLGYLAISFYQVWSTGRSDQARRSTPSS